MARAEDVRIEEIVKQHQPHLFSSLGAKERGQVIELLKTVTSSTELQMTAQLHHHSGPLPPADELKRYGEVLQEGAERIMSMAENQQRHRIKIEEIVIRAQQQQSANGQRMGFALVVLMVIAGTWLGLSGKEIASATVFGTTILGVASVFVAGKRSQAKDLHSKNS